MTCPTSGNRAPMKCTVPSSRDICHLSCELFWSVGVCTVLVSFRSTHVQIADQKTPETSNNNNNNNRSQQASKQASNKSILPSPTRWEKRQKLLKPGKRPNLKADWISAVTGRAFFFASGLFLMGREECLVID
ncbi:uncharacterized protein BO66DRAFT_12591 [Aspergillus aculeatinus CBS 121060]|uniref:Uncharacterized protein n=1 Tax=Aspergillus aculeatinus CBS 121060 TaxID=1448322 RepID=A0ACD1HQ20_9EURO|nr:hypothetical protein BO66DRAFT_12591 [Aspergillus aculeatinus CBS 121060]RAH75602.1 hypothetical protein BO66DRAFT_12591 [Aspergillus aculeatinus CBS 121060]